MMNECPVCNELVKHSDECPETEDISVINTIQAANFFEKIIEIIDNSKNIKPSN